MSDFKPTVPPVKIDDGKDTWKIVVGISVATTALGYACKTIGEIIVNWYKTKQAKKLAEYEATTANTAKADAYERMRKADEALYRKKMEIDIEKRRRIKEQSEQEQQTRNGVQDNNSPIPKVDSFKKVLETAPTKLEWIVANKIEEGGRCIVFGPPGVGKSTFALQCAIAIAGGTKFFFLPPEEEKQHEAQQVIYIDLEMTPVEQKERTRGVTIPDNILRNTEAINNLDELFRLIEHESRGPKVTVIIDNIRKFEEEMSQTNQVNDYFCKLEQTQEKLAAKGITVTFITITHTAKDFDMYKPVQLNDVAGGADLSRFSTSVYALVPGREGTIVFKAVKQRNSTKMNEVCVLCFDKNPNLHLEFVRTCKEDEALPVKPKATKARTTSTGEKSKKKGNQKLDEADIELIKQLHSEGLNPKQIADKLNNKVCEQQVRRRIKELDAK